MLRLDPKTTAVVAIDMHRGHLDPSVATLPPAPDRCGPVLCAAFEATNRDFRVVVASDAVDSMDGEEMHRFVLRLMAAALGWPLSNTEILQALGA